MRFCTLSCQEVCKVPDELSYNKLLPLLIKHPVVVLQDYLLVLLCEHRRGILDGGGESGQANFKWSDAGLEL